MQQAAKFGRPIICFIDTKGAFPGRAAEERGQSEAIARNLMEMSGFEVPIICIVIGEGGSGGALALGVGDRLLMLENSTFSVISPEGAASILWKDGGKAKEAAEKLKITAPDLKELGVIDDIIPEIGGAHRDFTSQAELVDQAIAEHLSQLEKLDKQVLLEQRWEKYSNIGSFAE